MSNKRMCRKCGGQIPMKVEIHGHKKSLQNRKFCLICSPWGKHNTSANDPERRIKKSQISYSEWPDQWKNSLRQSNYKRTTERKKRLVEMSGGKCEICGYNKCLRALCFHHKFDKKFGLCGATLAQKSWDDILVEHKKCQLLCMNCHNELHDELSA